MRDQLDASDDALAFEDLDLDNDMLELLRVTGQDLLTELATRVLRATGDVPDGRAPRSLAPELEGADASAFLRLVAVNLAFRLRTDALLADLLAFVATAEPPRLAPATAGALLGRARSRRDALALIDASPLTEDARAVARDATTSDPGMASTGARLHVQAIHDDVEAALTRAIKPLTPLPWTQAATSEDARRFMLLRRRGGWTTVVEEGDRPAAELAPAIARGAGIRRVVWSSFGGGPPQLNVLEGAHTVLDTATLAQRIGEEPTADDVAGALRALCILDLDPDHPRGQTKLTFLANIEGSRSRTTRGLAFA